MYAKTEAAADAATAAAAAAASARMIRWLMACQTSTLPPTPGAVKLLRRSQLGPVAPPSDVRPTAADSPLDAASRACPNGLVS
jgi:hypothetical protein